MRLFQVPIRSFKSFRAALHDEVMRKECGIVDACIIESNDDSIRIRVQHRIRISPKLAARFPKLKRHLP
jgi:DNA polymerase III sliding clamp (beta) subunit (PCNA family)